MLPYDSRLYVPNHNPGSVSSLPCYSGGYFIDFWYLFVRVTPLTLTLFIQWNFNICFSNICIYICIALKFFHIGYLCSIVVHNAGIGCYISVHDTVCQYNFGIIIFQDFLFPSPPPSPGPFSLLCWSPIEIPYIPAWTPPPPPPLPLVFFFLSASTFERKHDALDLLIWLVSLNIFVSCSISFLANNILSFFFKSEWNSIVYIHHIFFSHSLVYGHLGWFPVSYCVNWAVMNMAVHVTPWYNDCTFRSIQMSDIVGSYGGSMTSLLRNLHTAFHNGHANVQSHQECKSVPLIHMLCSICYCWYSWWLPFWLVWDEIWV